jgi:hypothetical protein
MNRVVGAETLLASVTQRSGTSAKTKISMSPTLKMITDVSIDLERLFNS